MCPKDRSEQARLVKTVKVHCGDSASPSWIRPSVPPLGDWRTGIAIDWVTGRSYSCGRWLDVQSGLGKPYGVFEQSCTCEVLVVACDLGVMG